MSMCSRRGFRWLLATKRSFCRQGCFFHAVMFIDGDEFWFDVRASVVQSIKTSEVMLQEVCVVVFCMFIRFVFSSFVQILLTELPCKCSTFCPVITSTSGSSFHNAGVPFLLIFCKFPAILCCMYGTVENTTSGLFGPLENADLCGFFLLPPLKGIYKNCSFCWLCYNWFLTESVEKHCPDIMQSYFHVLSWMTAYICLC